MFLLWGGVVVVCVFVVLAFFWVVSLVGLGCGGGFCLCALFVFFVFMGGVLVWVWFCCWFLALLFSVLFGCWLVVVLFGWLMGGVLVFVLWVFVGAFGGDWFEFCGFFLFFCLGEFFFGGWGLVVLGLLGFFVVGLFVMFLCGVYCGCFVGWFFGLWDFGVVWAVVFRFLVGIGFVFLWFG